MNAKKRSMFSSEPEQRRVDTAPLVDTLTAMRARQLAPAAGMSLVLVFGAGGCGDSGTEAAGVSDQTRSTRVAEARLRASPARSWRLRRRGGLRPQGPRRPRWQRLPRDDAGRFRRGLAARLRERPEPHGGVRRRRLDHARERAPDRWRGTSRSRARPRPAAASAYAAASSRSAGATSSCASCACGAAY